VRKIGVEEGASRASDAQALDIAGAWVARSARLVHFLPAFGREMG